MMRASCCWLRSSGLRLLFPDGLTWFLPPHSYVMHPDADSGVLRMLAPSGALDGNQTMSYLGSPHGALVRFPQCQIQMRVLPHMYNIPHCLPLHDVAIVRVVPVVIRACIDKVRLGLHVWHRNIVDRALFRPIMVDGSNGLDLIRSSGGKRDACREKSTSPKFTDKTVRISGIDMAMSRRDEKSEYQDMYARRIERNPLRLHFRSEEETIILGHVQHASVSRFTKEVEVVDPLPVVEDYVPSIEHELRLLLRIETAGRKAIPPFPLNLTTENAMSKGMLEELQISWNS
ncbi:hypothetical protein PsorP6_003617 [Peronosclerospora sorghi]|uniref:Uncharacterized protein n=1 Tax=Peronosclerospora sorghi TaxID=230839 RepID=A0ACC0VNY6_9STRA|nr:hypothetical protein PsorP6_003617 [Peronosclerospora sorghi]